jgi:serine/threonine-protein phosphatase 2A regulatory subunit B
VLFRSNTNAADVISAVEFNADGSYLATGDKGGRVVLFEKVASQGVSSISISV